MAAGGGTHRGAHPAFAWWGALLLCIVVQLGLASAAASTLFMPDANTTISFNLPPGESGDVNFYILSPDFFQYTAIGFGTTMANSLMFVTYNSADNSHITVSPRFSSGDTEPAYAPDIQFTINGGSGVFDDVRVLNVTCHGCRSWATGSIDAKSTAQPMIYAYGPGVSLSSDSPSAGIRRHMWYGRFNVDLVQATGPGGLPLPTDVTQGASVVGDITVDSDKGALAHGVLFAVTILAIAPVDSLVAFALSRWPILHGLTATVYLGFVIGGLVTGVAVSKEHIMTQKYQTPHQVLGLLTVALFFAMFLWGIGLGIIRHSAKKREQQPPEQSALLRKIHQWLSLGIWLLLIINGGLGLKLVQSSTVFMIGYGVLVGGVFVLLLPIWFCIWRCSRRRQEKAQDEHELQEPNIYNHAGYEYGH